MRDVAWQVEQRVYDTNSQNSQKPRAWLPIGKPIMAPDLSTALTRLRDRIEQDVRPHQTEGAYRLVRQDHIRVVPWTAERSVSTRVRLGAPR